MSSQAQIDANRRNSQQSTGPRTAPGKARTRRNAARHNLCADVALMHDEDAEQFLLLLADLREEHQPDGPTEELLVYKLAEHTWFGWRASILLAEKLDNNDFEDSRHQITLMLRYHTTADRGFLNNLTQLRKLQKERREAEPPMEPEVNAPQPQPEPIGSVSQNPPEQPEIAPEPQSQPPMQLIHPSPNPADFPPSARNRIENQKKSA